MSSDRCVRERWYKSKYDARSREVVYAITSLPPEKAGAAPQTLAAFRNTVLTLMRRRSGTITEEIEHFQENRQHALNLVRFGRIE